MSSERKQDEVGDKLVQTLVSAARDQARVAMEAHADPFDARNRLTTALAAGVAVELALKAALAAILPSLLAEKGDAHSQLHLMGRSGVPGKSQSDVRTIGGMAAWQIYSQLRRQSGISQDDVKAVLDIRNSAAHLAAVDRAELVKGVRAMAICLDRLLPELGMTSNDFWGAEFEVQAAALVKEVIDAREIRIEQARSAALLHLSRLKALGEDAFDAIVMTLDKEGLEREETDDKCGQPFECPVCGYTGWLSGVIERGDLHVDDQDPPDVWVDRLLVPTAFECRVCGFALWNEDVASAGIPGVILLEPDNDPWELEQIYEDAQADAAYEAMREAGQ